LPPDPRLAAIYKIAGILTQVIYEYSSLARAAEHPAVGRASRSSTVFHHPHSSVAQHQDTGAEHANLRLQCVAARGIVVGLAA
jgi:hypothetical protein